MYAQADNGNGNRLTETRREQLGQDATRIATIKEARQDHRKLRRWGRLVKLSDQQKQDMLRSLLPSATGAGITIHLIDEKTPMDPDSPDQVGDWYVEINGLLPLEQSNIKSVVLGGALAVP